MSPETSPFAPSPDPGERSGTALTMTAPRQAVWKEGRSRTTPGHELKLPTFGALGDPK